MSITINNQKIIKIEVLYVKVKRVDLTLSTVLIL